MWFRNYSHEKMRDGDMSAALLHSWFCAALHWCLGKTQACAEHGQLAMKGPNSHFWGQFFLGGSRQKT